MKKMSEPKRDGYTLLESLIALAILLSIIVPLLTFFYKYASDSTAQKSFTAICLLEQEAAMTVSFPEDVVPVKRKMIAGREWSVRTDVSGKDPIVYRMTALLNNRGIDSVVFYGRNAHVEKK
jgi:prepilin-type N-terminal cleavage/methylation domain-containing protein